MSYLHRFDWMVVCSAAAVFADVAMAQLWYDDGRTVNVLKRFQSIDLNHHQALNTVHRCHLIACLKMFLHRLELAHNSVLFRQRWRHRRRCQWPPDNLRSIWVRSNSNLLPHHSPLIFRHCCHLCHWWWCCCCYCYCCRHYYCQQIQIDPPNHRRLGCRDFRAHYYCLIPLLVHPMPMSFFATTNRPHLKQKNWFSFTFSF